MRTLGLSLLVLASIGCGWRTGTAPAGEGRPIDGSTDRDSGVPPRDGGPLACGDGLCDPSVGETCETCPTDCEWCAEPICGDGLCGPDSAERCDTCPIDCGSCTVGCGDG